MIYKDYGNTGKKVSALGFGGMRFRKEDYSRDPEISAEVVRYANSKGINYFDTAPSYCDDMSENIFGLAFVNMPGQFYVSTKSATWDEKTSSEVQRRCEKSLRRLGVSKINFFHMWCIMDMDHYRNVMAPGGPYEGALRLKQDGLIDHICISTHASGAEIKQIVDEGGYEGILLGYNATNFAFREEGIKSAYARHMGIVTMNPLGGGIIPQNPKFYSFINENSGDTLAQAALRFNISHKEISVTLSGMGTKAEVDENIVAAQEYNELTPDRINKLKKHLHASLNSMCTGCGYCDSCPVDIPIPKMMDSYNSLIISGDKSGIIDRLNNQWGGLRNDLASKCIECGKCEKLCTQHLPIINRLKEISDLKEP